MKTVLGGLALIGGLAFGIWLGVVYMLYGGIVQAIDGTTTSVIACGILKAVFCEFGVMAGVVAGMIVAVIIHAVFKD